MQLFEKCPVTELEYPAEEGCEGHIIPDALGGTTRTRNQKSIDNQVGTKFDSELSNLIHFITDLKAGRCVGSVRMPSLIDGPIYRVSISEKKINREMTQREMTKGIGSRLKSEL